MKYYIYISDTKLDMMFDQIAKDQRLRTAKELKLDLKLLSASIKTERERSKSRMAKLQIVMDYLRKKADVGPCESGSAYIEDTLDMKWGPLVGYSEEEVPFVYFGGLTANAMIGLAGSKKHILGGCPSPNPGQGGSSATPAILGALSHFLEIAIPDIFHFPYKNDANHALQLVRLSTGYARGSVQRLSFLARTLLEGDNPEPDFKYNDLLWGGDKTRVWLGTPLWVCLAD